jgi:hypothetical protein
MATQWYYRIAGEDRGPVSSHELRAQVRSHIVSTETLVRRAADRDWVPAREVPGLLNGNATAQSPQAEPNEDSPSTGLKRRNNIRTTALGLCDEIEDTIGIIRGLIEYYDLNRRQVATICEIIIPIAEQLRDLEQDLP